MYSSASANVDVCRVFDWVLKFEVFFRSKIGGGGRFSSSPSLPVFPEERSLASYDDCPPPVNVIKLQHVDACAAS